MDKMDASKDNAAELLAEQINNLSLAGGKSGTDSAADFIELPVEIKYQECFYSWLEGASDSKFPNLSLKINRNEKDSSPKGGVEVAISASELKLYESCHSLFYLTEVKNFGEADRTFKELNSFISQMPQDEELSVDSLNGYLYLATNLNAYLLWKKSEFGQLDAYMTQMPKKSFPQLTSGAQITVLRFKLMAARHYRLSTQLNIAEKLAELEPVNAKWFYYVYFYSRDVRRKGSLTAPPEKTETVAIAKALELEPDNFVYIVTGFQNLSERIRYFNAKELLENPISWSGREFSSVEQIMEYMKTETRLLLKYSENVPGYCYTLLGEIFSSCLPRNLVDFPLAEKCIRRALDVSPECTRINHRMGIFLWKTARNFNSAVTYLQRACEFSPQNFHSRGDLIHLLLSKPEEQKEVLQECFDLYLAEDASWAWDFREISELTFLKGCFLLMTNGGATEILRLWIKAYNLNPASNHFQTVYRQSKRFMWSFNDFNFGRCRDVISQVLDKGGLNAEELDTVAKLSEAILKGVQELESEGRHVNRNVNRPRQRSESDESSWRSDNNRRGRNNNSNSEDNRGKGRGRGFGYNNSHSRPFHRNRTSSGSENSNWRE